MKNNLLIFILLTTAVNAYCQPGVKIYAFERSSAPGTVAAEVKDENGNSASKAAARPNYFLFLSYGRKVSIRPVRVFIKGKPFLVRSSQTRETPVVDSAEIFPGKSEQKILIPVTKNKVVELFIDELRIAPAKKPNLIKLLRSNDVVLLYWWKNKQHYLCQRKIKELERRENE